MKEKNRESGSEQFAVDATEAAWLVGIGIGLWKELVRDRKAPQGFYLGSLHKWSKDVLRNWIRDGALPCDQWEEIKRERAIERAQNKNSSRAATQGQPTDNRPTTGAAKSPAKFDLQNKKST